MRVSVKDWTTIVNFVWSFIADRQFSGGLIMFTELYDSEYPIFQSYPRDDTAGVVCIASYDGCSRPGIPDFISPL